MYLRGDPFSSRTWRYEDCNLATAIGIVLAGYAGFFFVLYWLMQPSITPNPGLAAYRPPPKTIVHYADSPWVPPATSEALPIRAADQSPRSQKVASLRSRRRRQRSKRDGQLPDGRSPSESNQIRSGVMLHPAHSVLVPGSDAGGIAA